MQKAKQFTMEILIDGDTAENRALCEMKAKAMWATFTQSEKTLVRFGMFPADKMREAAEPARRTA